MAEPTDVQHLVKQLMAGASPEENRALLDALMSGQVSSIFEKLKRDHAPTLLPIPDLKRTRFMLMFASGRSALLRAAAAILSATSMPSVTSPKTV